MRQCLSTFAASGQPNLTHYLHYCLHCEFLVNFLLLEPVLLYNFGPYAFHDPFNLLDIQFFNHWVILLVVVIIMLLCWVHLLVMNLAHWVLLVDLGRTIVWRVDSIVVVWLSELVQVGDCVELSWQRLVVAHLRIFDTFEILILFVVLIICLFLRVTIVLLRGLFLCILCK